MGKQGMAFGLAVLMVFLAPAWGQQEQDRTIQKLYTECKSQDASNQTACRYYLLGVADLMLDFGRTLTATKNTLGGERVVLSSYAICVDLVSAQQLAQVFINWAEKNPDLWQRDREVGATAALHQTFPCE